MHLARVDGVWELGDMLTTYLHMYCLVYLVCINMDKIVWYTHQFAIELEITDRRDRSSQNLKPCWYIRY